MFEPAPSIHVYHIQRPTYGYIENLHFDEEIIITSRLTYVYARSKEN